MSSRRDFIKTTAIGGAGLVGGLHLSKALAWDMPQSPTVLYQSAYALMQEWAPALLALQVLDKSRTDDYGGIWCPGDKTVHGRVGDTIYPFMYLADKTKDSRYLDSAMLLYKWIDRRVSQPDGSWLNEPVKGSWKGTTVFMAIALAEALKNHGALLDTQFKNELEARLKKAGDYVYNNFNVEYGNINYPVTGSYALSLLGTILDEPKFKTKGHDLAHQALQFMSKKDSLLTGEGGPIYQPSKKGCFSVDLGYNVEESLPSLVMYGLLNKDEEVLGAVTRSMQAHMEFMLPDGGWDNSWGTRNYKWTYWGSRTSDGCQTAYALMADRDPRFYRVALKNVQQFKQCSHQGLLQGGPHNVSHNITPCVHHTFTHIKSLTTILDHGDQHKQINTKVELPRERAYGYRFFSDIQTGLVAKGKYRATITGYDREYKETRNGHATGGALTMLWHELTGPILAGSMNAYQIFEAGNQPVDTDPLSMPLTPRIELKVDGKTYMNISYLDAKIDVADGDVLIINTQSKLVDKDQRSPETGDINCKVTYIFSKDKVLLKFSHDGGHDGIRVIIPIISKAAEMVEMVSDKAIRFHKEKALVGITANHPLVKLPTTTGRIYNAVPGLEAVPLAIDQNDCEIEIRVV
jgi:hypothetical protein